MEIVCPAQDCQYKTAKMDPKLAMDLLTIHNSHMHGSNNNSSSSKAESLKRPEICHDASESVWRDFELQWKRYKRSTGISGSDVIDQLICCCSNTLRMDINSEHGEEVNTLTENKLLDTIKSMALCKTNPMVFRNKMK